VAAVLMDKRLKLVDMVAVQLERRVLTNMELAEMEALKLVLGPLVKQELLAEEGMVNIVLAATEELEAVAGMEVLALPQMALVTMKKAEVEVLVMYILVQLLEIILQDVC